MLSKLVIYESITKILFGTYFLILRFAVMRGQNYVYWPFQRKRFMLSGTALKWGDIEFKKEYTRR